MNYTAKNFETLANLEGLSERLIKNHLSLYQGYVTNINKVNDQLVSLESEGKTAEPAYAEMKRRAGWEWNGMRLHELYFANLIKGGTELDQQSALCKIICENFKTLAGWDQNFRATAAMRGIGWVILYQDKPSGLLFNAWINEHDAGHFAGATPLVVMDVFEHAYMIDYDLKKADYISAFMKLINWPEVEKRSKMS